MHHLRSDTTAADGAEAIRELTSDEIEAVSGGIGPVLLYKAVAWIGEQVAETWNAIKTADKSKRLCSPGTFEGCFEDP